MRRFGGANSFIENQFQHLLALYRRDPTFLIHDIRKSKEFRLVSYVLSLYTVLLTWGFLQEKLSTRDYECVESNERWDYPIILNFFVTTSASLTGFLVEYFCSPISQIPVFTFWRLALASALASPIGYISLKYISFPLLVLSKSSKHVPVMLIGRLWYNQRYEWFKYFGVGLLCCGICLFSFGFC